MGKGGGRIVSSGLRAGRSFDLSAESVLAYQYWICVGIGRRTLNLGLRGEPLIYGNGMSHGSNLIVWVADIRTTSHL